MKHIYKRLFLITISIFFITVSWAQQQPSSAIEDVVNAVRSGNVDGIASYFDNIVPVTINSNQSTYSRTQAAMVLKDFFSKNVPKDLTIMNSGTSNNAKYAIGDLITSTGKYSLYVLLKQKDNSGYVLQEIRLNK